MLRNSWAHVVDQWRASKEWRYFSENTEWKLLAPSLSKLNSLCYELAGSSAKRQLHIFRAAAKTMLEPMTEAQRGACLAACPELLVAVPKDQMSEMSSRLLPWVEVCLTQNRGIFNSLACLLAATASGRVVEPTAFVSLLLSWAAPSDADDGIDVCYDATTLMFDARHRLQRRLSQQRQRPRRKASGLRLNGWDRRTTCQTGQPSSVSSLVR